MQDVADRDIIYVCASLVTKNAHTGHLVSKACCHIGLHVVNLIKHQTADMDADSDVIIVEETQAIADEVESPAAKRRRTGDDEGNNHSEEQRSGTGPGYVQDDVQLVGVSFNQSRVEKGKAPALPAGPADVMKYENLESINWNDHDFSDLYDLTDEQLEDYIAGGSSGASSSRQTAYRTARVAAFKEVRAEQEQAMQPYIEVLEVPDSEAEDDEVLPNSADHNNNRIPEQGTTAGADAGHAVAQPETSAATDADEAEPQPQQLQPQPEQQPRQQSEEDDSIEQRQRQELQQQQRRIQRPRQGATNGAPPRPPSR